MEGARTVRPWKGRRWTWACTGLIALPLVSCGPPGGISRPNIVLIVIDTLRADHLAFYGYEHDTAPFLSELAESGLVFENVVAPSSWTAPSTASLFTSLEPVQHGVLSGVLATKKMQEFDESVTLNRIPGEIVTLPEILKSAGYATFGVSDNFNVSQALGFDQGFDAFVMHNYEGAPGVNAQVKRWTSRILRSDPYFLYLHYMDPHFPYHPWDPWYEEPSSPDEFGQARYDTEIRYVDEHIRALFDELGWREDAVVIVTSDHGEEFGDHGWVQHGKTLYEEVVRVPLLLHVPGDAGGRVTDPATLLDVLPTIRDIALLGEDALDEGVSLWPAREGEPVASPDRLRLGHVRRQVYRGGLTRRSARRDGWKYIESSDGTAELYELGKDPHEATSRLEDRPDIAEQLQQAIEDFEARCVRFLPEETKTSLDAATLERLRALGYVRN